MVLAERRGWTPDTVDAQDPAFMDAYWSFIVAEGDYRAEQQRAERKRQDRTAKHHKYDNRHL